MRHALWFILGAVATMLAAQVRADAQEYADWTRCVNDENTFTAEDVISGCNGVIASGKEGRAIIAIAHHYRGLAHERNGNLDLAIADFNKAIELDPEPAQPYFSRGSALQDKGENDKALGDYSKAVDLDPFYATAFNGRCWLRALLNVDLPLAIKDCERAVALDPNDANFLDSRAFAFFRSGRLDEAISDYDAALAMDPKQAGSLYGRGLTKRARGDKVGGDADIAAAIALKADVAKEFDKFGVQ